MNVLVAHASRHGATSGIAERIAEVLRESGVEAVARDVGEVGDVEHYDAFVIGGAAYMFHWLRPATKFVRRHREILATRPVWLFSSGPLGTDLVDDQGRDVLEVARPKEFAELVGLVGPRDAHVFFGAWDPDAPPVGIAERFMKHLPKDAEGLPEGDFRDWDAVEDWARDIAGQLRREAPDPVRA